MGKGIKTREVVKEIKVHDTAINVGDRMKNVGVKTKDTVNENINQADNVSPEQYATDKVSESMRTGSETVAVGTEKAVRKGVSKAKEKIQEKKAEKNRPTSRESVCCFSITLYAPVRSKSYLHSDKRCRHP